LLLFFKKEVLSSDLSLMVKRPTVDAALTRYRAKRRFDETPEPRGKAVTKPGALYLIQKHDATRLHYDLRLELDGVLLSWAVTRGPSYSTKDKRLAVRTEDHPLEYGHFEGTIPKGNYGGGTVMLWDTGTWEPVGDPHEGLEKGKLAFILHGERLRGHWALVRMQPREREKNENWLLIKENDALANTHATLLDDEITSVVSGRGMTDIARTDEVWDAKANTTKLPAFVEPALATLVDAAPSGKDWLFEVKYDGYRALIAADGEAVRIYTRSGLDWTKKFTGIAKAVAALRLKQTLLDTEIVVIDKSGRTDFTALVAALEDGKTALSCFVFDVLTQAGKDLRKNPLRERKACLQKLLGKPEKSSPVQYSEDFSGDGAALLKTACQHGLEGIIAKRADRPYVSGRGQDWLKIKCGHAQEFIIIGFSASEKRRSFASVLLALREGGEWRYAGRVGSGFSEAALERLGRWRDANRAEKPPCDVPAALRRGVAWVQPELVAAIAFAGWTGDHMLRHGRFMGLREDKQPVEVKREMPAVKLSHPDKLMYPDDGVTKADVAAYIQAAAPLMLPYMKDRFLSLVRCPDGANEKGFFQRHPAAGFGEDWLSEEFSNKAGKKERYIYFEDPAALLAAVQMGVLEFHLWGARRETVQQPDRIVFDLDPDPSVAFGAVKQAALRLREVLSALGLESLPLLSGGKGIHVVVPVQPQHEWPVVKQFSAALAGRLAADAPKQFVATMSKAKRTGKIFIDHFRNEIGSTAIAPYSPRARPGAAVAWPVSWAALGKVESANAMTIEKAKNAIETGENGWAEYFKIKQRLTPAAIKAVG
jgi:bifunctional non-homologous end joining protein LigD